MTYAMMKGVTITMASKMPQVIASDLTSVKMRAQMER
jgi:hypothetical protein